MMELPETPHTKTDHGFLKWMPAIGLGIMLVAQAAVQYSRLEQIYESVHRHDESLARIEDGSATALKNIVERLVTDEKRGDEAINAINSRLDAIRSKFISDNGQIGDLKAQMAVLATKSDLEREQIKLLGDRVASMIELRVVRR